MSDVKKILLVADYGPGDLAFREVTQKLYESAARRDLRIQIDTVSANAFDTTQTAMLVAGAAQLAPGKGGYDLIYHNTAPRFDTDNGQVNNSGEPLAHTVVRHEAGGETQIVGVFSGGHKSLNTFAKLPPDAQREIHTVDCLNSGSQFRSRDRFVESVIGALDDRPLKERNPIRLKKARLIVPPIEPEALGVAEYQRARITAVKRLRAVSAEPLEAHGDASVAYVTLIAPKGSAQTQLAAAKAQDAEAQIDALALKTDATEKSPDNGDGRWIEAGFAAAQLAMNASNRPPRTIVALTKDDSALGSTPLLEAVLDSGVKILTDDVRALAFAQPRIAALHTDASPARYGAFTVGNLAEVAPLPKGLTPAYIDGYGNMKLAATKEALIERLRLETGKLNGDLPPGEQAIASVEIHGQTLDAIVSGGSFDKKAGQSVISSGSSGWGDRWDAPEGEKQYFAELFTRGKSTAKLFEDGEHGAPQVGTPVTLRFKEVQKALPSPSVAADGLEQQRSLSTRTAGK